MKDAIGNTLEIGDKVVYITAGKVKRLTTGIIQSFSPQGVNLEGTWVTNRPARLVVKAYKE